MERRINKRAAALLLSVMVFLGTAVGSSVAYIVTETEAVTNVFQPSTVACEVTQNGTSYSVKNTGDTDAYVRVAVVVNWRNGDGYVYATTPEHNVSFDADWAKGNDGYYYYTQPVTSNNVTATGITVTADDGEAPADGYSLSIEIVASAIQATAAAVADWSSGVATATADGGNLTVSQPTT